MALTVALGFLTLLTTYLAQQSVNVTHCYAAESLDCDITSSLKMSSVWHSSSLIWYCDSGANTHRGFFTIYIVSMNLLVLCLRTARQVQCSPSFISIVGAFLFSCSISINSLTVLSRCRIKKHLTYSCSKKEKKIVYKSQIPPGAEVLPSSATQFSSAAQFAHLGDSLFLKMMYKN